MADEGDGDAHVLGYRSVDDDPHIDVLVATMEATSRWPATKELRTWERAHLALARGERLIDVGCGLGEAARALADDLGPGGEVVGVDASAAMLAVARRRAHEAACPMHFRVGDARALDEPVGVFDAARSERTLQWLDDPAAAVAEMARVLRPGGRLALIDTDWSTLRLDVGDAGIEQAVRAALREERRRASNVGRRLPELVAAVGCRDVARTSATQVWTTWDPDVDPAPDGCFSMRSLAEDLVEARQLDHDGVADFVATVHDAARAGRFSLSLTMHAVVATRRA